MKFSSPVDSVFTEFEACVKDADFPLSFGESGIKLRLYRNGESHKIACTGFPGVFVPPGGTGFAVVAGGTGNDFRKGEAGGVVGSGIGTRIILFEFSRVITPLSVDATFVPKMIIVYNCYFQVYIIVHHYNT